MKLVQLPGEADHRSPAEGDHYGARPKSGDAATADPVERRLPLEEADLGLRERVPHEWQRLDRAEQQDVAVLAAEEETRPGRAALLVLRPLHLVEHERLAARRRHFRGAAHDRRVRVDPLLARDEADALFSDLGREPPMRLLREHAEWRRVDASTGLDEEAQGIVGLARVRGPEVRDHRLRLDVPLGKPDRQLRDGPPRRLTSPVAVAPARS